MAIICASYSIIIPRVQRKKNAGRALTVHNSNIQPIKVSASLIKAPLAIKVFEDQAKGIVCYRDSKGELICEGYDEGPRLIPHPSHKTYHQRCGELQIPDFLTQRWFQILQDQN
ncbi:uncharacterized protein LOC109844378 [Asparagus officinalis]|uniref:uncharacterized protein LOC109844378 n=1 Tax=Asparagus officinalis TaxID=4686 RepID=UPI00098E3C5A|nr:uncharacterized protein LOC109844378 [Asparagus officinalis]